MVYLNAACITAACVAAACIAAAVLLLSGYMLVGCKKSCKVCDPAKTNTGRVIEVPVKTE